MHFVKLPAYHRNTSRALEYVRYISHREQVMPSGERRELYGIGERYKEVGQAIADPGERERAFKRLIKADAALFPQRFERGGRPHGGPIFHRPIFTLDDRAARIFASMPRDEADRALRETFRKALRSSSIGRQFQGVYAVHWHGGHGRVAHPHIHALLSPARTNGRPNYIGSRQLSRLKEGWSRAVERTLARLQKRPRSLVQNVDHASRVALGVARVIAHPERLPALLASQVMKGSVRPSRGSKSAGLSPVGAMSFALAFAQAPGKTAAGAALSLALSRVPALGMAYRFAQVLDGVRRR